eukprot:UN25403
MPRVQTIFHLAKLDDNLAPELVNSSLQFAYDPKVVGSILDFLPGTQKDKEGVIRLELAELVHASRFCHGLEPNQCAILGQKLLHEFSAPTPSMECINFNRHMNVIENHRK